MYNIFNILLINKSVIFYNNIIVFFKSMYKYLKR